MKSFKQRSNIIIIVFQKEYFCVRDGNNMIDTDILEKIVVIRVVVYRIYFFVMQCVV